jgi:hypothetical protein
MCVRGKVLWVRYVPLVGASGRGDGRSEKPDYVPQGEVHVDLARDA